MGIHPYLLERMKIMKMKEYKFDIEMIIDHEIKFYGKKQQVSTHHAMRGYTLKELTNLIRINNVPEEDDTKITFIIRGLIIND